MRKSIDQMIADLIKVEGGYVDNPHDKGGPTTHGVTEAVARANGYVGHMRDLPYGMAFAIYRKQYFIEPGFSLVYTVSQPVAEEMFDTGVNMGVSIPGSWLQRILNVLNQQGKLWADLVVDGQIGPATVACLRRALEHRGADAEKIIVRALNCLQGARYLDITENREKNESFFAGWLLNRVEM